MDILELLWMLRESYHGSRRIRDTIRGGEIVAVVVGCLETLVEEEVVSVG